jgi:hypothetical protein
MLLHSKSAKGRYQPCEADPVCHSIYTSEIFPNNMRGKGMAVAVGSYFLVLVVQLDTAPVALANIGWR